MLEFGFRVENNADCYIRWLRIVIYDEYFNLSNFAHDMNICKIYSFLGFYNYFKILSM